MKKLSIGPVLLLALLFAPSLFAQSPCGAVCQAYYPCDYACDLCVGDPGLWEIGGGCWGEIVQGTCGDIGQCGYVPCYPQWVYDDGGSYQGAAPFWDYDPCEWVFQNGQWEQVCDYNNAWKCTVYAVLHFDRHQTNCPPASEEEFCLINNGSTLYSGKYPAPWDSVCCSDSNYYNCTTYFPQCPNF